MLKNNRVGFDVDINLVESFDADVVRWLLLVTNIFSVECSVVLSNRLNGIVSVDVGSADSVIVVVLNGVDSDESMEYII